VIAALRGAPLEAARALLGRLLVSSIGGVEVALRLSEVEAYGGADDPASHAHSGETSRNHTMFGPPGRLYVYRSYGLHWCANVVCGPTGSPGAVLLRGGIPERGSEAMALRRGRRDHLADGPGRLCVALGITGDHDGLDLARGPVRVMGRPQAGSVTSGPRVGITRAPQRPWRLVWTPFR
jgi:DNA-3-methyladenine glycosylase